MLTSLLFHRPNQPFRIFLLVPSSFSETNKRNIIDSLSPWAPELEFILISAPELSGLKVSERISSAERSAACKAMILKLLSNAEGWMNGAGFDGETGLWDMR
jgi:hypothetical protein